jgi:nickel-dependent lactate racemase
METIDANHSRRSLSPTIGIDKFENNVVKQNMDETARMAGLDIKVDAIMNMKREITALFVGDPVAEHVAGCKLAARHYATDFVNDVEVVVANCYAKSNEMVLAGSLERAQKGLRRKGKGGRHPRCHNPILPRCAPGVNSGSGQAAILLVHFSLRR